MEEMEEKMEEEEEKVEEDKEDKISELPDEILVSIMCCLTTEQAATMSMISRRWLKIWNTTIPVMTRLTFDVDEIGWWSYEKINLINKVVKMHKAPTLDEFSLTAYNLHSKLNWHHHIIKWMDFAAKKHVKKLTLDLSPDMAYVATFVADNFHSLRELVIEGTHVTKNFIHRLFSNSPFLERFSLLRSNTLRKLNIASAPNLKYLKVGDYCFNLRHLEITSAHNLNTLEITGFVTLESLNICAPNLSHLLLGIQSTHEPFFKFDPYLTLLDQIKTLTLLIQGFDKIMMDQYPQFPRFIAVEHLELKMATGFKIPIHRLVPDLLKAAPLLKTFSFEEYKYTFGGHPAKKNGLNWLDKHIPSKVEVNQKYSWQYLKVVKLDIFAGCQYEVEFLMHLLKYAVSVEKIIIQPMPSTVWRNKKWCWCCYEDEFDNQYEVLCLGCAQLLKTRIGQMHPSAERKTKEGTFKSIKSQPRITNNLTSLKYEEEQKGSQPH